MQSVVPNSCIPRAFLIEWRIIEGQTKEHMEMTSPKSKADLFGDVPALAVLMLRVAGRIPDIGKTLNLMHIPVLLCGWSRSRC